MNHIKSFEEEMEKAYINEHFEEVLEDEYFNNWIERNSIKITLLADNE